MNAVDKARAFALIAEHMTATKRQEMADKIAEELVGGHRAVENTHGAQTLPGMGGDESPPDPIVTFLEAKGYREGNLVRLTARMTEVASRGGLVPPYSAALLARIYEEAVTDAVAP